MSTADRYAIPVENYEWKVPENFESRFKWEYEDGSPSLHRLYEKASCSNGMPAVASIGR